MPPAEFEAAYGEKQANPPWWSDSSEAVSGKLGAIHARASAHEQEHQRPRGSTHESTLAGYVQGRAQSNSRQPFSGIQRSFESP